MNGLAKINKSQVPAKLEDIQRFILVGREVLKAHMAKIRALDKIGEAFAAKEAALEDAQDLSEALIAAESKLGTMIAAIPNKFTSSREGTRTLPEGVTKKQSHQAQTLAANLGVSEQVMARAREEKRIATPEEVYREIKRNESKARVSDIASRKVATIAGKYDVIVIDPPWPMEKIEREVRPNQTGFDYPTMDEEQLSALKIPTAVDCHLWLWTTQRFLPMAFRLLEKWGARYVCTFVWHKPGGFQPIGLPQYNSEFVLYARIGSPTFKDTKSFFTCFDAPRGKHSEKPTEFYAVVRRVTEGRRLDMFGRRDIEGFTSWGNEV